MAFQDGALWDHMTVEQHLRFALGRSLPNRAEGDQRIEEILSMVGLADRKRERPAHFSGGERQRLGLARALVARPSLLFLDEPLAHLDLSSQRKLAEKVVELIRKHDMTTLWVTHRPGEVAFAGGAVSVMDNGRVAEQIAPGDVQDWLRVVGS
jgi:ABC-type multidrug transport system ATPase subunit